MNLIHAYTSSAHHRSGATNEVYFQATRYDLPSARPREDRCSISPTGSTPRGRPGMRTEETSYMAGKKSNQATAEEAKAIPVSKFSQPFTTLQLSSQLCMA